MNEEEIIAKAAELEAKALELEAKEGTLSAKEAEIESKAKDAEELARNIQVEYEARLEREKAEYERRLEEREKVIKQLARGDQAPAPTRTAFDELNEKRKQNKRV